MDIGFGNGLSNKLATYLAHNQIDKAREAVSSTFFMLILIIIPVTLLLIGIIAVTDLYSFLNVDSEVISDLKVVICISVLFVCVTFIFKFVGNFFLGIQLPAVNNLLVTCGHTFALIGTAILYFSGCRSLLMIALVNTSAPLLVYLLAYPYTFWYKYPHLSPSLKLFNGKSIKELFNIGIKFFILQISGAITFLSSNILISHFFTPAMATPYNISYRYFSVILLVFTIISTPYWTATTDAYERGDIDWIKNAMIRTRRLLSVIFAVIVFMILVAPFFYKILSGGTDLQIPFSITIGMASYMMIFIYGSAYCFFLNGIGALRIQLINAITAAILFIPIACISAYYSHHIVSILIVMCLINLPNIICNRIQFRKIVKGTATGLWIV